MTYLSYIAPPSDSEDLDLQATQCFVERENQSPEGEGICVVWMLVQVGAGSPDWWSLKVVKAGVGGAGSQEWVPRVLWKSQA